MVHVDDDKETIEITLNEALIIIALMVVTYIIVA